MLKQAGNSGFYLYGNHTHFLADALIPTLVNHPRETAVIVHPNNVSMPVLGRITPYLGALPLPDDRGAMKHFLEALTWHTDLWRLYYDLSKKHISGRFIPEYGRFLIHHSAIRCSRKLPSFLSDQYLSAQGKVSTFRRS